MVGLMNVLHLEGAKYNIRVNTLAPTAATAMTAGLLPPDAATLLSPESVTPAVLFLVSEDAPSRVILGAGAGVFAVTRIEETPGVYLAEAERSPDTIAARWNEIFSGRSRSRSKTPLPQTRKFAETGKRRRTGIVSGVLLASGGLAAARSVKAPR